MINDAAHIEEFPEDRVGFLDALRSTASRHKPEEMPESVDGQTLAVQASTSHRSGSRVRQSTEFPIHTQGSLQLSVR